jgi:hypothetical protein
MKDSRRQPGLFALVVALGLLWAGPGNAAPANDACASPTVVAALPFTDSVDISTATAVPSDPLRSCTSADTAHSVWYSFTASSDGVVTANTLSTSFDTVLTVYTGDCGTPVELACNDDSVGTPQSATTFAVTSGATYLLEVTAFNEGEAGTLHFAVAPAIAPSGDDCATPNVIGTTPFQSTLDTTQASTAASDPLSTTCGSGRNNASVWYRFDPPSDGTLTVDTFDSDYDTVVTAHTGTCGALTEAACNDDDENQAPQSHLAFPAVGGTSYLLEVTAYGPKSGGTLHLAVTFAPTFTDLRGLDDAAAAKAADKCQKAIIKGSGSFVGRKLGVLDKCGGALFKCAVAEPTAKRAACFVKAGAGCTKGFTKLVAARQKLTAAIVAKCAAPPLPFETGVRGAFGLAYASRAATCAGGTGSLAAIADCVASEHACRAEALFSSEHPRARELIELPQAQIALPSGSLVGCLADHGGDGAGVGDPAAVGKPLATCATAIRKAAAGFARAKLTAVTTCAAAVFTCRQTKPADAACVSTKARATCQKALAKAVGAATKLGLAIDKKCVGASVSYATLRQSNALGIDALASECVTFGVPNLDGFPQYQECVLRQHTCAAEALLGVEVPRAQPLIDALELGSSLQLPSPFCPTDS